MTSKLGETLPELVINMNLKKIQIHAHPEHMPAIKHLLDTDPEVPRILHKLAELEASGENIPVCLGCAMPEAECICFEIGLPKSSFWEETGETKYDFEIKASLEVSIQTGIVKIPEMKITIPLIYKAPEEARILEQSVMAALEKAGLKIQEDSSNSMREINE